MMEEERIESWMREQEIESDISSMVRKSSKLRLVLYVEIMLKKKFPIDDAKLRFALLAWL